MLLIKSQKKKPYCCAFPCYSLCYFALGYVTLHLCNSHFEEQVVDLRTCFKFKHGLAVNLTMVKDGRMATKCRARLCIPIVTRHFSVIPAVLVRL